MNRRNFSRLAMTLPLAAAASSNASGSSSPAPQPEDRDETEQSTYDGGLTDIDGFRVGHYTDPEQNTGCTVVLCGQGAVGGVSVRGASPGTRETDLLKPESTVEKVHAVMLSGGSAYGLETAAGAMQYLEERGIGYQVGDQIIPIVPAAILYDLRGRNAHIRPGKAEGYQACKNATDGLVQEGSVGAGAGATVGKLLGADRGMKGGIGSFSITVEDLTVAALVALNAAGDIVDPSSGQIIAGARQGARSPEFADVSRHLRQSKLAALQSGDGENTTLAVITTNASLTKAQAGKVADMAHNGYARTIRPAHTQVDGDTIFALSSGALSDFNPLQVGHLAAEAVAEAVVRAVKTAEPIRGFPSYETLIQLRRQRRG